VQGVEESKRYFELLKVYNVGPLKHNIDRHLLTIADLIQQKFKEEIKPTVANNSQWKQGATKSRMKLKRMMGQLINKRETILRIVSCSLYSLMISGAAQCSFAAPKIDKRYTYHFQ
jgi:hypothetical protein